jgi:lysozyme family protein
MKDDFARALPRILVYEGGKCEDAHDPGGRTNKGITQATFNAYLRSRGEPQKDVFEITDVEVEEIYQTRYWDVVQGDKLPTGLDLVVFDGAVNSGPGQSGKWLQQALTAEGHLDAAIDGLIGTKTLQAIEDAAGDAATLEALIGAYCSRRLATLQHLTTWKYFGPGWHARIANGLKTADAWAAEADEPPAVDVTADGGHKKAPVTDIKKSQVAEVAAHATTIAATTGAVAANASTQLQPVQAAFPHAGWLGYILGGLAAVGAVSGLVVQSINKVRAAAEKGSATATVNLDADAGRPQVSVTTLKAT